MAIVTNLRIRYVRSKRLLHEGKTGKRKPQGWSGSTARRVTVGRGPESWIARAGRLAGLARAML